MIKLISTIPPSTNHYLNYKVAGYKKKFVQSYHSEETIKYRNFFIPYVKNEIIYQKWKKPEKNKLIFVDLIIYFDRKRKDPNNYFKVMFDCFSDAGIWEDDDIALPRVNRIYIDKINPRIEINIYESNMTGIFNNKKQYIDFLKNNCNLCKKNKDKCSILKRLLENRILDEVKNLKCSKFSHKDV